MLLMTGAILCKGGRTVCGALKVLGLQGERAFANYHHVLNRDQWNALKGAKILLLQIIKAFRITELVIALDDHVERRSGKKINAKGCYRDAVRSSRGFIVRCFGLKWVVMMVAIKLPWSKRIFALPFLTVLAPSQKANQTQGSCGKIRIGRADEYRRNLIGNSDYRGVCKALVYRGHFPRSTGTFGRGDSTSMVE